MTVLKILLCIVALISYENTNQYNIVVIGRAANCKDGATVVCFKDKKRYYVSGLYRWEPKIVGKKIKVSGKLLVEELKEEPPIHGVIERQQLVGTKRTILNPKWEVIR